MYSESSDPSLVIVIFSSDCLGMPSLFFEQLPRSVLKMPCPRSWRLEDEIAEWMHRFGLFGAGAELIVHSRHLVEVKASPFPREGLLSLPLHPWLYIYCSGDVELPRGALLAPEPELGVDAAVVRRIHLIKMPK